MKAGRLLSYLVKLGLLIAVGYWIVENPGNIRVGWQDYVLETTTPVVIFGLFLIALPIGLLARFYRILRDWAIGHPHQRDLRKQDKAQALLAQGLVAVAAGDAALADKMAKKTRDLLGSSPLLALLEAQTAYLKGNRDQAEAAYRQLLVEPGMKFLGVRGLLNQSLRAQGIRLADGSVNAKALDHAREAYGLEPRSQAVLEILLELEIAAGYGDKALTLVDRLYKMAGLTEAAARQKRAAILLVMADHEDRAKNSVIARRRALKAAQLAPGFSPATIRAAQYCRDQKRIGAAKKLLQRGWASQPHPDLVTMWQTLDDNSDVLAAVRHLRVLCQGQHLEDHLALAEASLKAQLWGETRRHLDEAVARGGGARAFKMLAALAVAENKDEATARAWLEQAAEAPPQALWVSTITGATQQDWTAFARDNGRFDVLVWRMPISLLVA
jgi:HemY protein